MRVSSRPIYVVGLLAGLALLYISGLGVRRIVLEAQYDEQGRNLPFTLESALHFRRIKEILRTGSLRETDSNVFYPHGVRNREVYTVFSEYIHAGFSKLLPSSVSLQERVRWIETGWFCLGIPFMALWVGRWTGSWTAGALSALFYATSLAAVIRSTGQELSRENFALPLLIGHLCTHTWAIQAHRSGKRWVWGILSSALLALALLTWDLIQYYIGLWTLVVAVYLVFGLPRGQRDFLLWGICFSGTLLVGIGSPYFRAHSFFKGPIVLLGWGAIGVFLFDRFTQDRFPFRSCWVKTATRIVVLSLPILVGAWLAEGYVENYGHFGELLIAKIRFLNQKPSDPSLLTFNQRIMWVPALHSANIHLTFTLFPAIFFLTLAGLPIILRNAHSRSDARLTQLIFYFIASLITYWLFVRFHVFLVVFICALLGIFMSDAFARTAWKRSVMIGVLGVGLLVEARQTLSKPIQWGRPGVYYQELIELTDWLREHVSPEPVLANFGVSAAILSRADCPILLHPKFESKEIRDRVQAYGEQLFKGSELSFREFADKNGAGYYVYGKGEFSRTLPAYQMRYFIDELNPSAKAPARLFEGGDPTLTYFDLLWENRKYQVYRIRTRADEIEAVARALSAERAFQRGNIIRAEEEALLSLSLDADNEQALKILGHVISLRQKGFIYEVE